MPAAAAALSPSAALQDKGSAPKGTTKAEFTGILASFVAAARGKRAKKGSGGEGGGRDTVWVSFDNPTIHTKVDLPAGVKRVPLSPYSPDIHKIIEHVFGRIKPRLPEMCWDLTAGGTGLQPSLKVTRKAYKQVVRRHTAQETIAGDVRSLVLTLKVIAAEEGEFIEKVMRHGTRLIEGTAGDWAPKILR